MIQNVIHKVIRFPWARALCVLAGNEVFFGQLIGRPDSLGWAPVFATIVFAFVALQAIAVWREKS